MAFEFALARKEGCSKAQQKWNQKVWNSTSLFWNFPDRGRSVRRARAISRPSPTQSLKRIKKTQLEL